MRKLTVKTKEKTYDILIKKGILREICKYLPAREKIFLVTNDNLAGIYRDFVSKFKNVVLIKDGEEYKNFETYQFIIERLLCGKIERSSIVAAFGGGVTGDLAGFAAATVLRGTGFIQIPTTLLAQIDSSVGGKTGLNVKYGKNLAGAFYQPDLVLIDEEFLYTLPKRQLKTGFGEAIKYAFIEKNCSDNPEFYLYDYLTKGFSIEYINKLNCKNNCRHALNKDRPLNFSELIYKCAGLKASVVSKDEKEAGLRAVLNFGHTFAHSIETLTGYTEFTHGEAVALGIKSAFKLAFDLGLITKEYFAAAGGLIDKFGLGYNHNISFDKDKFIEVMKSDKKVISSKIRLILPVGRGEVKIFDNIDKNEIKRVI